MIGWSDRLRRLRSANADVELIMRFHERAARIHDETLVAMGQRPTVRSVISATTDVRIAPGPDHRSIRLLPKQHSENR